MKKLNTLQQRSKQVLVVLALLAVFQTVVLTSPQIASPGAVSLTNLQGAATRDLG